MKLCPESGSENSKYLTRCRQNLSDNKVKIEKLFPVHYPQESPWPYNLKINAYKTEKLLQLNVNKVH